MYVRLHFFPKETWSEFLVNSMINKNMEEYLEPSGYLKKKKKSIEELMYLHLFKFAFSYFVFFSIFGQNMIPLKPIFINLNSTGINADLSC